MSLRHVLGIATAGVLALSACGDDVAPAPDPPSGCSNPAPLVGEYDPRAPGFLVMFHPGIDTQTETERLATEYYFEPRYVYSTIPGFSAEFDESTLEAIRCEESVSRVQYNSFVEAFGRTAV